MHTGLFFRRTAYSERDEYTSCLLIGHFKDRLLLLVWHPCMLSGEGLENSLFLITVTIYTCNLRLPSPSDIFLQNPQNDNAFNIIPEGLLIRADIHL